MFYCRFFPFFYSPGYPELRRPIAEKLCYVIAIWVRFIMHVQKFGGRSVERRRTPASEVTTTMHRRWTSLRLRRELLCERERELELLQQGRIVSTSEQHRITLT